MYFIFIHLRQQYVVKHLFLDNLVFRISLENLILLWHLFEGYNKLYQLTNCPNLLKFNNSRMTIMVVCKGKEGIKFRC